MMHDISQSGSNLSGGAVITSAVGNLLEFTKYSRFFRRGLYSKLNDLLFQNPTFVGSRVIKSELTSLIMRELGQHIDGVTVNVTPDSPARKYHVEVLIKYQGITMSSVNRSYDAGAGA